VDAHGHNRIAFVEDEASVRTATRAFLEYGYRVIEAENGAEALDLVAATAEIDAVVTDTRPPDARVHDRTHPLKVRLTGQRHPGS
jgi:CheY-like chemotaxis protein